MRRNIVRIVEIFGISGKVWLVDLAIAAGSLAAVVIVKTVARFLLRNAGRTKTSIDDLLLALANGISLTLLVLPAISAGTHVLEMQGRIVRWIRLGAKLTFLAQIAVWLAALIGTWLEHYGRVRASDPASGTTIRLFRAGAVVLIWITTVITALAVMGFDVRTLLAGLGIGGVAVALATQNILSDLFASLSIVLDKPFVVGDDIMVENAIGTVERIGLKTTRVRSLTGEEVILSNSELLKKRIHNLGRMERRRVSFRLCVVYQTDPSKLDGVAAILRNAVEGAPNARFDRAHLAALTPAGFEFELVFYVTSPDYRLFMDVQHAVLLSIAKAFRDSGLRVAYPTQTLFLDAAATTTQPPLVGRAGYREQVPAAAPRI